ncbi:MAG: hypothetical protein M3P51_09345, partial [Chloroflexota bacterium]|nr:hypothetical protein [Chloroflexota bacterium]
KRWPSGVDGADGQNGLRLELNAGMRSKWCAAVDELARSAMQEVWNTEPGEPDRLVCAETDGGIPPTLLDIDDLCPVGSTFRRELVACLAQMFREAAR